jgi:uncharacterized protein with HEPN domain
MRRIETYTRGDRDICFASAFVQDAVVRNLRTLSESSQRLSDDVRRRAPSVPWRAQSPWRAFAMLSYTDTSASIWTRAGPSSSATCPI